jgi:hypothetical protein|tara:strand:- start:517 stop:666 length:150 start_codon:yes stop_codon:yes gene_type:complete
MYNHFLEFSQDEIIDAYGYFDSIKDYEGCRLVAEAFCTNMSFNFEYFFL